jgi:hypothetical protein
MGWNSGLCPNLIQIGLEIGSCQTIYAMTLKTNPVYQIFLSICQVRRILYGIDDGKISRPTVVPIHFGVVFVDQQFGIGEIFSGQLVTPDRPSILIAQVASVGRFRLVTRSKCRL